MALRADEAGLRIVSATIHVLVWDRERLDESRLLALHPVGPFIPILASGEGRGRLSKGRSSARGGQQDQDWPSTL